MGLLVPNIVDEGRGYDLFSKLLKERIILLDDEVNSNTATIICSSLMYLDSESQDDILFYINSPGGCVHSGLAIYDTMKLLKSDVATVVRGMAASMGAFLLSGGTPGKRFALENAQIMIHQVSSGTKGTVTDQKIALEHADKLNDLLARKLAEHTNKDLITIKKDIDRDFWMNAEEALEYGIIDKIGRPKTGVKIEE